MILNKTCVLSLIASKLIKKYWKMTTSIRGPYYESRFILHLKIFVILDKIASTKTFSFSFFSSLIS